MTVERTENHIDSGRGSGGVTDREAEGHRSWPIEPDRVRVWEDAFHVLHLRVDGEVFADVRAVCTFPISGKANYVSFVDEEGHETALVSDPERLDPESREVVERALEKMYYVPKVLRVDAISEAAGIALWRVQTDRGYASFEVVARENIRKLPHNRLLIQDADGNRYEIEDVSTLDSKSKVLIHSET